MPRHVRVTSWAKRVFSHDGQDCDGLTPARCGGGVLSSVLRWRTLQCTGAYSNGADAGVVRRPQRAPLPGMIVQAVCSRPSRAQPRMPSWASLPSSPSSSLPMARFSFGRNLSAFSMQLRLRRSPACEQMKSPHTAPRRVGRPPAPPGHAPPEACEAAWSAAPCSGPLCWCAVMCDHGARRRAEGSTAPRELARIDLARGAVTICLSVHVPGFTAVGKFLHGTW